MGGLALLLICAESKASTPTKRKRAVLDDESGWYQVVAGTTKTATVIHVSHLSSYQADQWIDRVRFFPYLHDIRRVSTEPVTEARSTAFDQRRIVFVLTLRY